MKSIKTSEIQEGRTINKEAEQRSRWEEHVKQILTRESSKERPYIPIAEMVLNVNTNPPSQSEISRALKSFKNGDTRSRRLPPEALQADLITITNVMHHLFQKNWEQEKVPK